MLPLASPVIPVLASSSISVADIFRAKIVDVEEDCLINELTGTQNKLEAFLNLLKDYEILELARTGITGLARGSKDVAFFLSGQDRRTAGRTCRTDKASKGQDLSLYWIPPKRKVTIFLIINFCCHFAFLLNEFKIYSRMLPISSGVSYIVKGLVLY